MNGFALLFLFFAMMLLGVPLYASLTMAGLIGIAVSGNLSLLRVIPQQFFGGMDSFSLMSIPFFIFTGTLMNRAGLTDRLIDFSRLIVGSVRGGLGYVNVIASVIFAGVNGSAAADASALGSILIPAMVKEGFPASYSAGITAGSSLIGPIIPPSIFMVIYASMTNTSIGGLFAAGLIPGVALGFAFLLMNWHYVRKYNVPKTDVAEVRSRALSVVARSLMALLAPFIVMCGIMTGLVTPTESGALASLYCVLVGVFMTRRLTPREFGLAVCDTLRVTSAIFMIMGAASVVGWYLKYARVTQSFSRLVVDAGLIAHPWLLMVVLSLIIFVVGMFMEEISVLTLLTPVFAPLAAKAGIDPLHFGVVMTLNVTIALITPPVGACNYIVAAVGKVPLGEMFRKIWPFVFTAFAVLALVITFPFCTTWIPKLMNL